MARPLRNTLLALTFSAVALGTAPAAVAGDGGGAFFGFLAGATIASILINQNHSSRRYYNSRSRYDRGYSGRYGYSGGYGHGYNSRYDNGYNGRYGHGYNGRYDHHGYNSR